MSDLETVRSQTLKNSAFAPATPVARTSHMRLLFLKRSTCSGEMTLPVNGPISVPAFIQVLEKMPSPSPGMELCAMMTSLGSTKLESFWTSGKRKREEVSELLDVLASKENKTYSIVLQTLFV